MQIKHGGCCLSARRHVRALINLCNFSRRERGCYRFCVTGWAPEHRLIAYGWIIHMREEIAGQLHGPCQWRSGGWRAGNCALMVRVKMIRAPLHQPLFSSLPAPRHLALICLVFLFFPPVSNTFRYLLMKLHWLLQQHSSMSWWCMFWWSWSSEYRLRLRQFMPNAWQQYGCQGLMESGGERSSWRGESVSEMKLQLCRFISTIHSHFWQLIC